MTRVRTVLIIEDEPLLRWSLARRLVTAGYRVIEAGTCQEALEAANEDVDLILLDLRLPDADGLSVLSPLRTYAPRARVIMMSAYATPERVSEVMGKGVDHFAAKPFHFDELIRNVEAVLGLPPGTR